MASGAEIFAGSIVQLDTAGNAEPGSTATGKICAGVAQEYKKNAGAAAAESIALRAGVFKLANGESITKAHIGDMCYILDDQTVYRTATGKSPCGVIVDVEADGVWVKIDMPLLQTSTGLLAANNLSDVASAATSRSNLGVSKMHCQLLVADLVAADAKRYFLTAPVGGTISKISSVLGGHALAVGDATLTSKINGTGVTTGVITITQAASAIGDQDSCSPSALKTVVAGDLIEILVGGANTDTEAWASVDVEITY
jgi:hypothetical protein